jgi:hypothetical protein
LGLMRSGRPRSTTARSAGRTCRPRCGSGARPRERR